MVPFMFGHRLDVMTLYQTVCTHL